MSFTKLGWANRSITGYNFLIEQDEEANQSTPPAPNAELSQDAIIGPMLKFIQQKMLAYIKKSQEEGKAAKLTPYRDRSIYFLQFIKDNFPELVNDKLAEIERKRPRERREGSLDVTPTDVENITEKKRIPSATEINWWFGNTLRSIVNGAEIYNNVKNELIAKTDNKSIQDYINVTATTRGERFKIDAGSFLPTSDISTALETPLSAFKTPSQRFEEQIPEESRVSIEETKDFLIQALEAFKSDQQDDPFISDSVDGIISGIEANTSAEALEDYITNQARKYNRIAQTEDDGSAKQLYNILGDIIENFRHFKLFKVIQDIPAAAGIKPGSLDDIKDDVIYNIEDFIEKNPSKYDENLRKVIDKIEELNSVNMITNYLEDRMKVLPTHSDPLIQKFGNAIQRLYNSILNKLDSLKRNESEINKLEDEMKEAEKQEDREKFTNESVRISSKQVNNLLIENYRSSIKNKVKCQQRYLY